MKQNIGTKRPKSLEIQGAKRPEFLVFNIIDNKFLFKNLLSITPKLKLDVKSWLQKSLKFVKTILRKIV